MQRLKLHDYVKDGEKVYCFDVTSTLVPVLLLWRGTITKANLIKEKYLIWKGLTVSEV